MCGGPTVFTIDYGRLEGLCKWSKKLLFIEPPPEVNGVIKPNPQGPNSLCVKAVESPVPENGGRMTARKGLFYITESP